MTTFNALAALPSVHPLLRAPGHVALGPYELNVEFMPRQQMVDKRRRACVNVELGRIELREDLRGRQVLEAFFECIIRLSHFSKGCQQGCVEEAYTQSFATGLVEFAKRNPEAWLWFNTLLSDHLVTRVRFDHVVSGLAARDPEMPECIVVAGYPVRLRRITKAESGNAFGWYHFDKFEAQLYSGLNGSNLAVVALHELTHAVHHMHEVKTRDKHCNFRRAQLKGWLDIIRNNPNAWCWLAWVMSFPAKARLMPVECELEFA